MTYLSEDPTYLAGGLLLLAGAFLVALKVTQQGKYLIRAGIALGLGLVVVVVEWLWVTDNERIEQVVYDLRRAVSEFGCRRRAACAHGAERPVLAGRYGALGRGDAGIDPAQPEPCPLRLCPDQRLADQCRAASAAGDSRIPRFRKREPEHVARRQLDVGTSDHGLVAGFPGDRAGRLEGEPDQPDLDPPGDLGLSRAGCRSRMILISASTTGSVTLGRDASSSLTRSRTACGNRRLPESGAMSQTATDDHQLLGRCSRLHWSQSQAGCRRAPSEKQPGISSLRHCASYRGG